MRQIDSSADPANHANKWNFGCDPGVDCYHADYFSGRIALAEKSLEEAESFLSKEIDLSYPFPQLYLGLLYFDQGLRRKAEEVWIGVPSISRYLIRLAKKLYFAEDRRPEARILCELAVKSEPENHTAHYFLGTILLHNATQPEDLRLSIEHSQRGVAGTVRDFWAYYNMGLAYERLNQYEDARKYYTQALTILPGDTSAVVKLKRISDLDSKPN